MSFEIRWTPEAEDSFGQIIAYLEEEWTEKEVQKFITRARTVFGHITEFPLMFEASPSNPSIRKGFVTKQCSLFYEVSEDNVILLHFWDNRMEPGKKAF